VCESYAANHYLLSRFISSPLINIDLGGKKKKPFSLLGLSKKSKEKKRGGKRCSFFLSVPLTCNKEEVLYFLQLMWKGKRAVVVVSPFPNLSRI